MLSYKHTTDLTSPVYQDGLQIRKVVFIEEQAVPPEIEIDDLEADCIHIVGYDEEGIPQATARLYPLAAGKYKVQRVAVRKEGRSKGYGRELMLEVERMARSLGAHSLKLGAQNHALPFYEKLGYHIISGEYEDAGIPHHDVTKELE